MTLKKKLQIRNNAITDLYNSQVLQQKIEGYMFRYQIPKDAGIEHDCLQVCIEQILKYDLDKLVEMILDNPNRLLGLAVTILNSKQVFGVEKRASKWWTGIAHSILHQSTLNTNYTINTTDTDSEDNTNLDLSQPPEEPEMIEQEHEQMWNWVKSKLTPPQRKILRFHLSSKQDKLTKEQKKELKTLLPILKQLITEYQNIN